MEILTDWFGRLGAGQMLARYGHYLAGACWLGLLYYVNFVQAPAFKEMTPQGRSESLQHLSRRVNTWVRWSALATALTGVLILYFQDVLLDPTDYFTTTRGTAVAFGGVLGLLMVLNVWLVIHPSQRTVITSAAQTDTGRSADPDAALAAKRLARATRCNVLLSIPMLWFMAVGPHFAEAALRFETYPGRDYLGSTWSVFIVIVGFIELSAIGQIGGYDSVANRAMFDDSRRSIAWGAILLAILWIGGFEAIVGQA